MREVVKELQKSDISKAIAVLGDSAIPIHYRLWGEPGEKPSNGIDPRFIETGYEESVAFWRIWKKF